MLFAIKSSFKFPALANERCHLPWCVNRELVGFRLFFNQEDGKNTNPRVYIKQLKGSQLLKMFNIEGFKKQCYPCFTLPEGSMGLTIKWPKN